MKSNPCRNCKHAYVYKNRYCSSFKLECRECEKRIKHQEYLKSVRKFEAGELITNFEDLLSCVWVMWNGKTTHISVIENQQLNTVLRMFSSKALRKAIKKEDA